MFRYPSNITFIYYNDIEYGTVFMEDILILTLVMDQGFAKVYQVNKTAFIGIVQLKNIMNNPGNTLISLNTSNLDKEYERIANLEVFDLTKIKSFPSIPLHSFFFNDKEGHRFEIQQFDNEVDRLKFENQ